MNPPSPSQDLLVLVADKNMEIVLHALLQRHRALHIPPLQCSIRIHPHRDPGCANSGHIFMQPFARQYRFGLIVFDREGCGKSRLTREQLETEVEHNLAACGWQNRSAVIVIDPELENWMWLESPHVSENLGWGKDMESLHIWLLDHGHVFSPVNKPVRPKEAIEEALRHKKISRSSSIYGHIAARVSFTACQDPAFLKLKRTLRNWFPIS